MSIKSLPFRAPLSKVAPRRRTPVERIFSAIETATATRALTRLTAKSKGRKLPSRTALAALGGGALAAIAAGAILARKRSSDVYEPPASMAPGASGASVNGESPETAAVTVDPAAPPVVASGADPEGAKLDIDAPNEGATGDHPA
jgi:hypothetical protein